MTYNIYIKTYSRTFNILNIDKEELNIVIQAYNKGFKDFFIGGKKYWLSDLLEIRIFTFDHPDGFDDFINLAKSKEVFSQSSFGKPFLTPEVLKVGGEEITKSLLKGDYGYLAAPKEAIDSRNDKFSIEIFISHSSEDIEIAKILIDIIRKAFNTSAEKIRCTSVPGYKLKAGVNTDEQLKKEIFSSKAFIGLITNNSIHSTYVLFELGARWGANLPLIPLICDKAGTSLLGGPIKNINALSAINSSDIHQFLYDLADILGLKPENPSGYVSDIQRLIQLVIGDDAKYVRPDLKDLIDEYKGADEIIKVQSEIEWPEDYEMRIHYIESQRKAISKLKQGKPNDLTEKEFNRIRERAAKTWPLDFQMRVHEEEKQIESLRKLKNI